MDNVVGSASIVIRPELAGFAATLEAESAAPLGAFQKKAETAGKGGGEKLSKGFKGGMGGFTSALSAVGVPLQTFGGRLDKTAASLANVETHGSKAGATLAHLGGTVLLGTTAALVAAGAAGVDLAMKYETATARIAATAGVGEKSAKQITDAFLNAAGKTEYSAKEVAQAYANIAGELGTVEGHALKAAEATKVMAAAQNLTAATGGKLAGTTEALGKVMLAYHLGAGQAAEASDVLFNASQKTGTSVESLAQAIGKIRGKLGEFAPSLGETGGLMIALAKHSLSGRQALGALNGVITGLAGANQKTKETQHALGVEVFNSAGHFVGLTKVIGELAPKLHGLSEEQQIQFLKLIGIKSGYAQFLPLLLEGQKAYEKTTAAAVKHNAAQEAAKKAEETLQAQVKKLEAELEALSTKLGNVLIPVLTKFAHGLSDGIDWLKKHEAACKALGVVIVTVLGGAIGAFVATKVAAFVGGIQSMIAAGGKLVAMLLTNLVPAFGTAEAEIVAGTEATAVSVDAALIGTGIGATLVLLGAAAFLLREHWQEVMVGLEEATQAAAHAVIGLVNKMIEGINALTSALTLGLAPALGKVSELSGAGGGGLTKVQEEGVAGVNKALEGKERLPGKGGTVEGMRASQIEEAATKYHISPKDLYGIFGTETSYGKNISTSSTGAKGAFQFEPGTAKKYGYPMTNSPNEKQFGEQADAAAKYLEHLVKTTGSLDAALAAYSGHTSGYAQKVAEHSKSLEHDIKALGEHTKAVKAHKAVEAYVQPIAGHPKVTREDMGLDFAVSDKTPIRAVGEGIVKTILQGWYKGQPLLEYELTKGAQKGRKLYAAEGIDPTVRVGQHLRAGQTIALAHSHGTGIEMGIAAGGGQTLAQARGEFHDHPGNDPTKASAEYKQMLASLGKGGGALSNSAAVYVNETKRIAALQATEAKKITADTKQGQGVLNKTIAAIQSKSVAQLEKVVGGLHDKYLKHLEGVLSRDHKDALKGMAGTVEKEHASALTKMIASLVKAHKEALAALQVALVKAAEKAAATRMGREDVIHTDEADAAAQAIGDATKVALDHAAEAGLAGAALIAAQAQSHLDELKAVDDASVSAAKLAVDRAAGMGEAAEATAKQQLVNAENAQKVQEAAATQALDLANNSAKEAEATKAADEKRQKEEEETTASRKKTAEEEAAKKAGGAASPAGNFTFYIGGANLSAADVMAEVGWALRTGTLPVAPPTPAHAAAAVA